MRGKAGVWGAFVRNKERSYDVAIISDARFPGGTSSSNAQEIKINHRAGLKTAFFHVPSSLLQNSKRPVSPQLRECQKLGFVDFLNPGDAAFAPLTVIRHPTVAMSDRGLPAALRTHRAIVVLNHPPAWFDGQRHYDLDEVARNVASALGTTAEMRPNSPVIARACENLGNSVGPCWYNVFDVPEEIRRTRSTSDPFVIGRHSRDSTDKWPENAQDVRQAYPDVEGVSVAVLGGAETARGLLGKLPSNWNVYPFNAMPVSEFLKKIDVYVYFHHTSYVEAFARAPSEAIISGVPTILPRSLEPLFEDACLYCEPDQVTTLVRRLQFEPEWRAHVARHGRKRMIERFGAQQHLERLRAMGLAISTVA